jgi:hypothetical protein
MSRVEDIKRTLNAIGQGWSEIDKEIETRVASLTQSLIASENPEVRGGIKALQDLKDFPTQLEVELKEIEAELP